MDRTNEYHPASGLRAISRTHHAVKLTFSAFESEAEFVAGFLPASPGSLVKMSTRASEVCASIDGSTLVMLFLAWTGGYPFFSILYRGIIFFYLAPQ